MYRDFVPHREADLVPFTNNFATQLSAKFAQVGRLSTDATTFAALNTAWVNAYAVANAAPTRTASNIQLKNAAKRACVAKLRELSALIQKYSGTTDALRTDFELPIPNPRSPIGVPTQIPVFEVTKRYGNTVIAGIHDGSGRRTKPAGVQSVRILSFVGPTPPESLVEWTMEGQSSKMEVQFDFDSNLPAGTVVWFTAAYVNPRQQVGPACQPISTFLAGGSMSIAA